MGDEFLTGGPPDENDPENQRQREIAYTVIWAPQHGPQTALLACPVFEVFFGGARGGGKTDGMLGEWASHADLYGEHAIGLMIRRELTQLVETIERSKQIFTPLGAQYHEQQKMWRWPNGARLRFAYLERDSDADGYQGHSYTRIYAEELGTFPSPIPIFKLMATLRSGVGVPCGFRATGNPGGPGHNWVKARYIDPNPSGWKIITTIYENPWGRKASKPIARDRVYIPSRVTDNAYLGDEYIANLQMSGNEQLVRAWLEGDWDVIDGAFFDGWRHDKHVIRPFQIPATWLRFRSMDWGYATPFSIGWWAVCPDDEWLDNRLIPRGAIIRYREWYGCKPGEPNVGLRITAEEVADGICLRDGKDVIKYGVLDPSAFAEAGGPSIAERMRKRKAIFRPADNARIAQHGAMGGWDQMRARLNGDGEYPALFVFETCTDFIRTVPVLQHDKDRLEDLDTQQEDHAADECRYACMSRPWIPKPKLPPVPTELIYEAKPDGRVVANMSVRQLVEAKMKRKAREA